uniref:DNA repair protein radA putative n=1 Tax=Albugo laibachii Nc14 TaxID=890382 RepID=F0VZV1_9STRA|nr:DNA repair protein radA putative [Albugo laibachii Nc14]|eukprot:CCA14322.1 DNA repair protein radA putative [Albugo laibachii Nc14]
MIRSWVCWLSKTQKIWPAHTWRNSKQHRSYDYKELGSERVFSSQHEASFYCRNCSQPFAKWQGQCPACETWGQITERKMFPSDINNGLAVGYRQPNAHTYNKAANGIIQAAARSSISWSGQSTDPKHTHLTQPIKMMHVEDHTISDERIALESKELNWVFGGGLVQGSLTLLSGSPGIGKSTLALQLANMLADSLNPMESGPIRRVLYISGEESLTQVRLRAQRLGKIHSSLYVASEINIDSIFQLVHSEENQEALNSECSFAGVIMDSIQTVFAPDIPSAAGTVNQVKECTLRFLRLAKEQNVPVILVGHVTKSGDIAGPKVLEHIVDTVMQLEGDPQSSRRFLRCLKNRFGTTSEIGVFDMTDTGLRTLTNPLLAYISPIHNESCNDAELPTTQSSESDGTAITITMEGSRPIPIEIQALVNRSHHNSLTQIRCVGVPFEKLQLLLAVLERRANVEFGNRSVFINVAEGYTIQEPAADLALAAALVSALTNHPLRSRGLLLGEIALSGALRPVKMLESRLMAAHKIGLTWSIIPLVTCPDTRKKLSKYDGLLKIHYVSTLMDALSLLFRNGGAKGAVIPR